MKGFSKNSSVLTFITITCLIVFITIFFTSCKGGLCSAIDDGLADADSDCTVDGSDNCPTIYNPVQFDGDDDGVGFECDVDDADDAVAMSLIKDPGELLGEDLDTTVLLDMNVATTHEFDLTRKDGFYYVLSTEGNFLGALLYDDQETLSLLNQDEEFGNAESALSLLNPLGVYGRPDNNFSSFSEDAQNPPKIFFRSNNDDSPDTFVGYLTANAEKTPAIDPCLILAELDVFSSFCE